jgi:hypothetical protein
MYNKKASNNLKIINHPPKLPPNQSPNTSNLITPIINPLKIKFPRIERVRTTPIAENVKKNKKSLQINIINLIKINSL